jgi:hypothetical protein
MGMNWGRSCYPVAFARESLADGIETPKAPKVENHGLGGHNIRHAAPIPSPISSPFHRKRGATRNNMAGSEREVLREVRCRQEQSVANRKALKIPRVHKTRAGSTPVSGTIHMSLREMPIFLIVHPEG